MGGFVGGGVLGLLAECALKGTAVLTLALLAAAASKRRPAAFRHFVLSFALVGLLLLPLLSLAPIGWRTSLLPARPMGAEAGIQARIDSNPVATPVEFSARNSDPVPVVSIGRASELPASEVKSLAFKPASVLRSSEIPPGFSSIRAEAPNRISLGIALVILWSAGFALLILRLGFGLAGAARLTREGAVLRDSVWLALLERFRSFASLRRKIRLRSHPRASVPLTWGWRKPVILMPESAGSWTEEERSSALFHELSHIRRADFVTMLLVRASLAMFWFNPLCWIVYRELRKEQEIACDELVLRAGIRPSTYAASLLAFRRSAGFRWNPSAALLGMLGPSTFRKRLAAILTHKRILKEVKMKTKVMLAAAVILAVALIGMARPSIDVEKKAAAPAAVAAAATVAAPSAAAPQAMQAEKAVAQEKEKEKAKAAAEAKPAAPTAMEKAIVFTSKDGGKSPIIITWVQGGETKKLVLDKPVTITFGKDEHTLVVSSEGKEIETLKGDPLSLEIKGGATLFLHEGKALKIDEGRVLRVGKEIGEKGGTIVIEGTPKPEVAKETYRIAKALEGKEGVRVVYESAKTREPRIAWTVKEPGKDGAVWVTKGVAADSLAKTWVMEDGKIRVLTSVSEKELLDTVRVLKEQLAAVKEKKLDITALEKTIEKLEADIKADNEKVGHFEFFPRPEPGRAARIEKFFKERPRGEAGLYVFKGDKAGIARYVKNSVTANDDGAIHIVYVNDEIEGKGGRAEYEKALARLKNALPEGYKLKDSKFDEEAGTMTFMIAPPEGKKADPEVVRKLADLFKEKDQK